MTYRYGVSCSRSAICTTITLGLQPRLAPDSLGVYETRSAGSLTGSPSSVKQL
jgi:hypothetical protein